ncbi:hypothetical protein Dsin_022923, partial [Dipteronia sinensis]
MTARPLEVKSSAELELDEFEKALTFREKPINKKIFESKGEMRIFYNIKKHQFHFETMARSNQHAETSSATSTEVSCQPRHDKPIPNTTTNPFHLYTD